MNITILAVGKLKEGYWQEAVREYAKRLQSYCTLQITEVRESPLPANPSRSNEQDVRDQEGLALLSRIKNGDYVIALQIEGRSLSSTELAARMQQLAIDGRSSIVFVIGGSLGLSEAVDRRADLRLSFSAMTFPHQMMRVILLEQIYRSFKIIRGETYHK